MSEPNSTRAGLAAAVVAVQAAAGTIHKDKTATVRSDKGVYTYTYASLDTILSTVRPLLAAHELAWITYPSTDETGPALRYELVHAPSGERAGGVMRLLVAKPDMQALGSALTYARRYALTAMLNLSVDDDDDGAAAAAAPSPKAKPAAGPSSAQRKAIQGIIADKGVKRPELARILADIGVELETGWMDKLTPGPKGTASQLIDALALLNRTDAGPGGTE